MGKRLFSGDTSPLPENLRCRRSDGRQWRCPQPAIPGLSFCEHHYHQVHRNHDNNKNSTKKTKKSSDLQPNKNPPFLPDSLRCRRSDGRKWRCSQPAIPGLGFCAHHQMRCKQIYNKKNKTGEDEEGIKEQALREKDEEEEVELAGDLRAAIKEPSLPDQLRCRRSDGRKWRCSQLCMPEIGFCEYHYLQVRRNQGKRKDSKLEKRRKRLKRRKKEERDGGMGESNVEVKRDLPNGLMAISPAPVRGPEISSPWLRWKIGSDDGYLFGRRFRSKNAELVPLGKVVVVSYVEKEK